MTGLPPKPSTIRRIAIAEAIAGLGLIVWWGSRDTDPGAPAVPGWWPWLLIVGIALCIGALLEPVTARLLQHFYGPRSVVDDPGEDGEGDTYTRVADRP